MGPSICGRPQPGCAICAAVLGCWHAASCGAGGWAWHAVVPCRAHTGPVRPHLWVDAGRGAASHRRGRPTAAGRQPPQRQCRRSRLPVPAVQRHGCTPGDAGRAHVGPLRRLPPARPSSCTHPAGPIRGGAAGAPRTQCAGSRGGGCGASPVQRAGHPRDVVGICCRAMGRLPVATSGACAPADSGPAVGRRTRSCLHTRGAFPLSVGTAGPGAVRPAGRLGASPHWHGGVEHWCRAIFSLHQA
mmetsp:Transcript_18617/g.47693  ORF Transcript_18617/g.47693 Transcript_18617/m.47693 type:complete len:244 (-) Transcript_18617:1730-2461(-)